MNIKSLQPRDHEAKIILQWMECGVFEALQKCVVCNHALETVRMCVCVFRVSCFRFPQFHNAMTFAYLKLHQSIYGTAARRS
jgi:hypothetical protein